MGDTEQIVAEPDEGEAGEGVEAAHPASLDPQNPQLVTNVFYSVVSLVAANGWYCVGLAAVGYLAWLKVQPRLAVWRDRRHQDQEAAEYHKNPDKILARERAMDAARQRMQDEYNRRAELHAEKVKETEDKKRQERIDDWERHQRGEGYRNKTKGAPGPSEPTAAACFRPSGKPRLRPEYNPLTGEGGGSGRYRPEPRGGAGGG